MPKSPQDLTGKVFGYLAVIGRSPNRGRLIMWNCVCVCGNKKIIRGDYLTQNRVASCGCGHVRKIRQSNRIKNLEEKMVGKNFGRLTVISFESFHGTNDYWNCRCQCGRHTIAQRSNLNSGKVGSCGCLQRELRDVATTALVGKRFGKLVVLSVANDRNSLGEIVVNCLCDCGKTFTRAGYQITCTTKRGNIPSCGCGRSCRVIHAGKRFGSLIVVSQVKRTSTRDTVSWVCRCDCGSLCNVPSSALLSGHKKRCDSPIHRRGAANHRWKGGRLMNKDGYVSVYAPGGHARAKGYVREHTLVMEKHIGRRLRDGETVHHKNGDRADNRISNLELWEHNHHPGQRIIDKIDFCLEMEDLYPEMLVERRKFRDASKRRGIEEQLEYMDCEVDSQQLIYR